jgi:hypothetical protein
MINEDGYKLVDKVILSPKIPVFQTKPLELNMSLILDVDKANKLKKAGQPKKKKVSKKVVEPKKKHSSWSFPPLRQTTDTSPKKQKGVPIKNHQAVQEYERNRLLQVQQFDAKELESLKQDSTQRILQNHQNRCKSVDSPSDFDCVRRTDFEFDNKS